MAQLLMSVTMATAQPATGVLALNIDALIERLADEMDDVRRITAVVDGSRLKVAPLTLLAHTPWPEPLS
jgi:hypothetical protein